MQGELHGLAAREEESVYAHLALLCVARPRRAWLVEVRIRRIEAMHSPAALPQWRRTSIAPHSCSEWVGAVSAPAFGDEEI